MAERSDHLPTEEVTRDKDFWHVLYSRRSVRRYQPKTIPTVQIERLIDAACQAPSSHNSQPWRFVIVAAGSVRQRLADSMAARFAKDLRRDGIDQEEVARQVARSKERITGAPELIVPCLTTEDMKRHSDTVLQALERQMGVQSVASAIGYLLLAAEAEGLAACWMCAPLFCPDIVVDGLDLPSHWQPQALITLGVAAESPRSKTLAPLTSRMVLR